jgi:hypothetical protein
MRNFAKRFDPHRTAHRVAFIPYRYLLSVQFCWNQHFPHRWNCKAPETTLTYRNWPAYNNSLKPLGCILISNGRSSMHSPLSLSLSLLPLQFLSLTKLQLLHSAQHIISCLWPLGDRYPLKPHTASVPVMCIHPHVQLARSRHWHRRRTLVHILVIRVALHTIGTGMRLTAAAVALSKRVMT